MKPLLIACLTLPIATAGIASSIYRCEMDGRVIFSQTPCATDAEKLDIKTTPGGHGSPPGADEHLKALQDLNERRQQRREQGRGGGQVYMDDTLAERNRVVSAIANNRVFVGMSAADARRSWGNPTRINRSTSASGTTEQWVYRRGNRASYLYIRDGKISSIQN